jgi:small ligand-binding sensory domain FIST
MGRADVIAAAIDRAVRTAYVDDEELCRFDPAALDDVVRLCDSGWSRDAALEAVAEVLQRAVEDLDGDRTVAAVALRSRIEAATTRRQLPVENLQGDVGAGRGLVTDEP